MTDKRVASEVEVDAIRREYAGGALNVRKWCEILDCSPETVRRIARRDTYRKVAASLEPVAVSPVAPAVQEAADESLALLARHTPKDQLGSANRILDQLARKGHDDE